MKPLNFRKTALTKVGGFTPAKKHCTVVQPVPKKSK